MLDKLHTLDERGYKYYFQFSINPYDNRFEENVPEKDILIDIFKKLSERIGKDKVIWRYDPIFLTDEIDLNYHYMHFESLAGSLKDYTKRCVISFMDLYKKNQKNLKKLNMRDLNIEEKYKIAEYISRIASQNNITVETCAELIDLSNFNITHGKCIDDRLVSDIIGEDIHVKRENQRKGCDCVKNIDIGAYDSCEFNCIYCYANSSQTTVENNIALHDPNSPLLIGNIKDSDEIKPRDCRSHRISCSCTA